MDNRLEEIRKRDELYNGQFTTIVYSDRRWLLGEVDAQREELGRLRKSNQYFIGVLDELDRFGLLGILDNLGGDSDGVRFMVAEARRVLEGKEE